MDVSDSSISTTHTLAGFGFYPTGPAPVDPVKAKAKARWKMVAKFLRPGNGADGVGADLKAVSVRRHSSFDLLPVLKVRNQSKSAETSNWQSRLPPPLTVMLAGQSEAATREGSEEASYEWVHYSLEPVCPGKGSVAVRQRAGGKVTLKDMRESFSTGVDNTGNRLVLPVCVKHYGA